MKLTLENLIASIPLIYLLAVGIPLIVIDIKQRRLPNKLVLPMLALELICLPTASAISGEWTRLGSALLVGLGMFIIGMVLNRYLLLGMGDVKLLTFSVLGLCWFSPMLALAIPLFGLLSVMIVGSAVIYIFRMRVDTIPLGPYIISVFGVCVSILAVAG